MKLTSLILKAEWCLCFCLFQDGGGLVYLADLVTFFTFQRHMVTRFGLRHQLLQPLSSRGHCNTLADIPAFTGVVQQESVKHQQKKQRLQTAVTAALQQGSVKYFSGNTSCYSYCPAGVDVTAPVSRFDGLNTLFL